MERFSVKNMPKYYGFFNSKDAVAIAMQMARQGDMLDFINSRGAMTERGAGVVFGQVCRTLAQAHKAGISHRDIKLENVRFPAKISSSRWDRIFPFNCLTIVLALNRWRIRFDLRLGTSGVRSNR